MINISNSNSNVKENKMGVMPVNKLLLTMAIPMMISMLVQALYNVVDSVFVSHVSQNAFAAVSYVFPIQNLMIAVGVGVGVGMNALISKSLGQKDQNKADKYAMQGLLLNVISFLIFLAAGLFFASAFMKSQTNDKEILKYGIKYFRICLVYSGGLFLELIFEKMLQATGRTMLSMIVQGTGAIINIICDPIFIFEKGEALSFFGIRFIMPVGLGLDVAGAAYATVLGQTVAGILGLVLSLKYNKEINMKLKNLRPKLKYIKDILFIGVPSIIMASIGSVMTLCMNKILSGFGTLYVNVFGAYFKLQSFVFMPVFGLNNGMVPIVAYNYGARKKQRMYQAIKFATIYAVAIMFVGIACCQMIPDKLLTAFNANEEMLNIGIPALRIISLSFIFAGFCIVASSVFQALGKSIYSLLLSAGRQLVVLIPAAYFLSLTENATLVWLSFPIAEIMSVILSATFLRKILKELDWQ